MSVADLYPHRTCFFTTDSANQKAKFISNLNKTFGSGGGFTCAFSDTELVRFLQFLKADSESIPVSKGSTIIGMQPNSSVWVLNETTQISDDGSLIPPDGGSYTWTPTCIAANCDKVCLAELVPTISPELDVQPSEHLVNLLEQNCKHNFISALLVLGGAVMSCHYQTIVQQFGGFPIVLAVGPTETGKSTAIKAALSLFGMTKAGFYVDGSNAYFMERSALSCLPYGIDEGTTDKQLDLVKLIIALNGGAKTANLRRGAFRPLSVPIIATNFMLKNDPRCVVRLHVHLYVYCVLAT